MCMYVVHVVRSLVFTPFSPSNTFACADVASFFLYISSPSPSYFLFLCLFIRLQKEESNLIYQE